jgi:hypothetical protein
VKISTETNGSLIFTLPSYTRLYQPFAAEDRLKNIQEFSPYRKENTAFHRYKDQPVNAI